MQVRELIDVISLSIGSTNLVLSTIVVNNSKLSKSLLLLGLILVVLSGFSNLIANQLIISDTFKVPKMTSILIGIGTILAIVGFITSEITRYPSKPFEFDSVSFALLFYILSSVLIINTAVSFKYD